MAERGFGALRRIQPPAIRLHPDKSFSHLVLRTCPRLTSLGCEPELRRARKILLPDQTCCGRARAPRRAAVLVQGSSNEQPGSYLLLPDVVTQGTTPPVARRTSP